MRAGDEEARRLLAAIAVAPRAAGTSDEKNARDFCAAFLREHGFRTSEEHFQYSAFAGTIATPLAGAVLASLFVLTTLNAVNMNRAGEGASTQRSLVIVVVHLLLLAAVALLSTRKSILGLALLRRSAINLVAEQEGATGAPRLWLMAHLDSKSQPVSILARAGGAIASIVVVCVLILLAIGQLFVAVSIAPGWWFATSVFGVLASLPLIFSVVHNRSRGALDNASGVVAILLAAAALSRREGSSPGGLGVVITSAEEVGLAGAHAWCANRPRGLAINCDSVDDVGGFLCLAGATRVGEDTVASAVREAAKVSETQYRERRRLVGILVDSMALEARGWDAVTISRGTLGSLGRIHTAADVPEACEGRGSAAAAILIRDASSAILARV